MKKIIVFMLMGLLSFGIMFLIASCANDTFTVNYLTEGGGQIKGAATQTVRSGERTTEVEAIPQQGYYFVGWSDEQSSAVRHEEDVTSDQTFTAKFEKQTYHLSYLSDENGTIEGEENQALKYGDRSSSVRAVPNEGYRFVQWSDGETSATRRDTARTDKTMTAEFEEIRFHFRYDYGMATGNCSEEGSEILYWSVPQTKLLVPEREHFYFKGWYLGDLQITNELGDFVINASDLSDRSDLSDDEMMVSPKWAPMETFTYKVLLVYVTEINGTFITKEGDEFEVDFQMSDLDRKICKTTTIQLQTYLNDLMEGLVDFKVDNYFTTIPLSATEFRRSQYGEEYCHWVNPSDIAEVKPILGNYKSVLSVIEFSEDFTFLPLGGGVSGLGNEKEGTVFLDSSLRRYTSIYGPKEQLLDPSQKGWRTYLTSYVYEVILTTELQINPPPMMLDDVMTYFISQGIYNEWEIMKEYMLGVAMVNGERVGIPYEFWKQL